jgi:hypothetical protein
MKHQAILIIILLASSTCAQDKPKLIGEIEFFGYSGIKLDNGPIDLHKVKTALPFQEKDEFSGETFPELAEKSAEAVKRLTGHPPTDINSTCCDDQGNWIIFIGLSGKTIRYNDPPNGATRLPANILNLYERFFKVMMESVAKGAAAEDHSQGYALSPSPPLRAIQLEMRAYAVGHEVLLRRVLATAADVQQRIVAAQLLGFTKQSRTQIAALVRAHLDSNGTVRNNATRALIVLADSSSSVAMKIPVAGFVEQLLSGTWTDLNKAGFLLDSITKSDKGKIPDALRRKEVRDRLIEMARWRTGHAEAARHILARMGENIRRAG